MGAESIVVDPGVDFTKTPAQSVALLRGIDRTVALGHLVLLALCRKVRGRLDRQAASGRGAGQPRCGGRGRERAGQILRVHDVAATRNFLLVLDAVRGDADVPDDLMLPEHLHHDR